ncbi:hypothetical protein DCO58_08045 [Helicobacter saguini]|uniref:Peptidase n=1 Tax=Helicobacter saguini TaxID=1548018 RepID=A0A347VNL3_9HELI|nr:PepSY domain-containing protein [Helicobacter saguini]MWV61722.1 hypothetical protein [Helicobacter saguini]MWV67606.1 hypothetical protein [Helicobacter saguini]MWV69957.1 hypothetical protein [Helicobacter saguini]MWV72829.1 hypothetical protein [Helicobacter saguini]TLD92371.1 hypothetical protein LS64_010270 [Helicobacter saguini]
MFKNKSMWMKVHTYLSLFFLPAALIYAFTGALWILNVRADAGANITEFQVQDVQKGKEQELILSELAKRDLEIPTNTHLREQRGNLTMGNIAYSVTLQKDKNGEYKIRVVERSLYGILLLMHLSKGSFWFDIIAIGFALSLIIFYFSGLIMTSFCKRKRKPALITFFAGLFITSLMVYLSVVM